MDRYKERDYDNAISYMEWSKQELEALEETISKLQDELDSANGTIEDQAKEIQELKKELEGY